MDYVNEARAALKDDEMRRACDLLERSVVMADDGDMRSEHYRDVLNDYVVVAADLGRLLPAAPTLMKKFCRAAEINLGCADWSQTGFDMVSAILLTG
jgi:hypothetical protein